MTVKDMNIIIEDAQNRLQKTQNATDRDFWLVVIIDCQAQLKRLENRYERFIKEND